jgi:uncharacterized protein (DUF342 family)
MSSGEERSLENLIRGSEALIRDLELTGAEHLPGADKTDAAPASIQDQADIPFDSLEEPSIDGVAEITVSKDEMLARACFHPPTGNGKPLILDIVRGLIEAEKITTGIDWEGIKGCLLTCNEERIEVPDIVVARGTSPVNETPPYLVLSDALTARVKREEVSQARVDFKELSLFTLVKKGDVLAALVPKSEGAMGTSIRGVAVPFKKEPVFFPKPGKNTAWQAGEVVSQCAGRFQSNADSFWVDEVLDILGNIDLRVGNIDFPGDVVIRGEICDGFTVKAGKSILCMGAIGAARITCAGDLVTQQGIVGKEKATIRVGGTAEAKFIEGCVLDAVGPIKVKTSVLNSTVHTRDRLEMGERGIIIGGVVKAQNGVSAAQIGTERGPRTEIHCGIDFNVEQKLIWIRDKNIALAFKLREMENKMKASPRARELLSPLHGKVKTAIHQLNENARALVSGLDRNEEADVSIWGTVYPGTYIEICHVSHFITRPRRAASYRLDKTSGKIVEAYCDRIERRKAPKK